MNRYLFLVVGAGVAFGLAGCGQKQEEKSKPVEAPKPQLSEEEKAMAEWNKVVVKVEAGCKENTSTSMVYRIRGNGVKKSDSLKYPFTGTVLVRYKGLDYANATEFGIDFHFAWDKASGKWVCIPLGGLQDKGAEWARALLKYVL